MSLTVPAEVAERTVEAYSRTDPNGTPYYNTCSLIVGDGTVKIEFEKGRADVPMSLAAVIARNPHIHVPGVDGTAAPVAEDGALAAENETLRLRLADMEKTLKRAAGQQPEPTTAPADAVKKTGVELPADGVTRAVEITGEDVPEKVRLAMEHLAQEGEDVPEPGSALPAPGSIDALQELTADGQARCQAVKADGSQCSNAAVDDTGACAIGRHQAKAPE